MSARLKKTAAQRKAMRYGTKRYVVFEVRRRLREHAKATRRWANDNSNSWGIEHDWIISAGYAGGVIHGFKAIGALTAEQYQQACRRLERISAKKVTRRPFVLKAAA